MKQAIFGIVDEHTVQSLVLELKQSGFSDTEISIVIPNARTPQDTDLVSDARQGATTGGVLGALAAEFATLTSLMIPGVGPFLIGGPIVTALAGASVGGVIGGLTAATGRLAGIVGIPRSAVKRYEKELKRGRGLVMVDYDAPEDRGRAERAFREMGITETHEADPRESAA